MTSRRVPVLILLCVALTASAMAQGGRGGGPRTPVRDRQPIAANAAGTGVLSGRVTSTEGAPVRRAQVLLLCVDRITRSATTDSEGRYTFAEVPAGRYTVRATKGG